MAGSASGSSISWSVLTREPLNTSARSAFSSERPQIVHALDGTPVCLLAYGKPASLRCLRCDRSDSSRSAVLQAGTVCPQGKKCLPEERSARYGRVAQRPQRSNGGLRGAKKPLRSADQRVIEMRPLRQNPSGRAFAGPPPRFGSLIWNDQTTRANRFLARRFLPSANRTRHETALAQAKTEIPAKTRRARAELFRGSLGRCC